MTDSRGFDISRGLDDSLVSDFLYLDANSIIYLFEKTDRHHEATKAFYKENILKNRSVYSYSDFTLEEVRNVLKKNYMIREYNSKSIREYNNYSDEQCLRIVNYIDSELDKIEKFLEDDAIKLDYDNLTIEAKTREITRLNPRVDYADAKHLQIMRENNINSIITHDQGFLDTKGFNIYGSSNLIREDFRKNNHSKIITTEEFNIVYK